MSGGFTISFGDDNYPVAVLRERLELDKRCRHAAPWRKVETIDGPHRMQVKHHGRFMDRMQIHDEIRRLILAIMRLERLDAEDQIAARYYASCRRSGEYDRTIDRCENCGSDAREVGKAHYEGPQCSRCLGLEEDDDPDDHDGMTEEETADAAGLVRCCATHGRWVDPGDTCAELDAEEGGEG